MGIIPIPGRYPQEAHPKFEVSRVYIVIARPFRDSYHDPVSNKIVNKHCLRIKRNCFGVIPGIKLETCIN